MKRADAQIIIYFGINSFKTAVPVLISEIRIFKLRTLGCIKRNGERRRFKSF
jgi:hypothetical protein